MTRSLNKLILTSALVAGLSACGGGNNSPPPPPPPPVGTNPPPTPSPPPMMSVAEKLGATFAAVFGAPRDSQPINPKPGDIVPVDKTAQPINF